MKFLFSLIVILCLFVSQVVQAATVTFAGTSTDISTNLSYIVVYKSAPLLPRLGYINATSDKAGSVIQFYTAGTPTVITTNVASSTTISTPSTGYSTNDVIVTYNVSTGALTRTSVAGTVAAGSFTAAATLTLPVGSLVWKMTATGAIPVGNATKELNAAGGAIYNGVASAPFLFEIDGTSACQINAASGWFEK